MNRPVPLIRRSTPISPHDQRDDVELEDLRSVPGRGKRAEWRTLRNLHRCVILAEAGAGKTFVLQAEAARLAARGRPAFFIRIDDIDEAFGTAFCLGLPRPPFRPLPPRPLRSIPPRALATISSAPRWAPFEDAGR